MAQPCQRCTHYEATYQAVGLYVCQYCQVQLFDPPLPQLEDSYQGDPSKCSRCQTPFVNSYQCQSCFYVELALWSDAVLEPAKQIAAPQTWQVQDSKCWTCGNCRYEYNLLDAGICVHCHQPKASGPQPAQADAPMQVVSGDAYYGANPSGASEAPWRCQYCGQGEGQCACYAAWSESGNTAQSNPQPTVSTWKCPNCGQENSAQVATCQNCQWVPVTKCGLCGQDSEGDICQMCKQTRLRTEAEAQQSSPPPVERQTPSPVSPVERQIPSPVLPVERQPPSPVLPVAASPQTQPKKPIRTSEPQPKNPVQAPAKTPVPLQATYWTCKACQRKNDSLTVKCFCGQYEHWEDYFKDKNIKLSQDKTMWTCKKCPTQVSLRQCICSACGKTNKDVASFIKAEPTCHLF